MYNFPSKNTNLKIATELSEQLQFTDSFEEFKLALSTPRGSYFCKTRNKEHLSRLPEKKKKADYAYYKNVELSDFGMVSFHLILFPPPQTNSYIIPKVLELKKKK